MRYTSAVALCAASIAVASCGKTPTGQIVAVVNGEEISQTELNEELQLANVPASADKKAVQRDLLQRVIDRRLLAQAAKDDGVDRDPAYLSAQRRSNENLLIQFYAKRAADQIKVPDAAAIDRYVAQNPAAFAQRAQLKLDQVRFAMPANPETLKQFQNDHSMEAVVATLGRLQIKFERGNASLDTGAVPVEVLNQIEKLPAGEPFVVPAGGIVMVSVVQGRAPVAFPQDQWKPKAVEALRGQSLSTVGRDRLKAARAKAKIDYQPGFAPAAPAKPAAPK